MNKTTKVLAALMLMVTAFVAVGCLNIGKPHKKHQSVDLGLPSGTKWATCNVGAKTPEAFGGYFAWGETKPKERYDWSNYQYTMGTDSEMMKYCTNPEYGINGYTDGLLFLEPGDDAATVNWGKKWRTPTFEQWKELHENTTQSVTVRNGVNGMLFTGRNGKSIFLPFAGSSAKNATKRGQNENGSYWTSLLHTESHADASDAAMMYFISNNTPNMSFVEIEAPRYMGMTIRPVRKK
ncbi:MAG: hypothetical protein J6P83_07060 [Bacteroidales bacterium]|jgi:hypothetical protein|nr:hypothetical protein [Bacteroidales bacterium]